MDSDRIKRGEPGFGPVLALTVVGALGAFGVFAPLAHLLLPSTALPAPFPPQHQDAETLSFVIAFAVILPVTLILMPRAAAGITQAHSSAVFSRVSGGLAALLLLLLLLVKAADRLTSLGGAETLLVAMALWCLLAAVVLGRATRGRETFAIGPPPLSLEVTWAAVLTLAALALLAFVDLGSIPPLVAVLGAILAATVVLLYLRDRYPADAGPVGRWIDVGTVIVLLFAVPNLLIFDLGDDYQTRIIDFHQNFFLGPANHVLGGGAMLVDTLSQYGVASIYLLAAWFQVAPIGNGTLGFLEGVLSAFVFIAAFLTMRFAGASRLLTVTAILVALVTLVYGLVYPLGALLQHGAIRFGLPVIPLLAATLEFKHPRVARPAQAAQVLAVGLASIWALEAFVYTAMTMVAILAVRVWLLPATDRWRCARRWIAGLVAACAAAHFILALTTVLTAGELPDWGLYLNTLREFLTGSIGDLTYDFLDWSPALAVGAFYLASAAALVLTLRLRPDLARSRPATMVALAGSTAYGVALFSYFVNRSAAHILPYVCLPAMVAGTIWLGLLLSEHERVSMRTRAAGLGSGLFISVVLIAAAWPGAGERFSQSALAYAIPGGGPTLSEGLHRLWNPPDLIDGASEGAVVLAACAPGEKHSYVLTDADLSIEILNKAGRSNAFPFGDPWEDSFVPDPHLDELQAAVDGLRPGDLILMDASTLETYRTYLREPGRDPLTDPLGEESIVPTGIARLQEWLLKEIGERYALRAKCSLPGDSAPAVFSLTPRDTHQPGSQ